MVVKFEICKNFEKSSPGQVVGIPSNNELNELVAVDLGEFKCKKSFMVIFWFIAKEWLKNKVIRK